MVKFSSAQACFKRLPTAFFRTGIFRVNGHQNLWAQDKDPALFLAQGDAGFSQGLKSQWENN